MGVIDGALNIIEMEIESKLGLIKFVRSLTKNIVDQMEFSEIDKFRVNLAVDEICSNSVRYAYPEKSGKVSVSFGFDSEKLEVKIKDNGKGFDLKEVKPVQFADFADLTVESGRGIFMTKELMDEVDICSKPGKGTEVKMVKYCKQE